MHRQEGYEKNAHCLYCYRCRDITIHKELNPRYAQKNSTYICSKNMKHTREAKATLNFVDIHGHYPVVGITMPPIESNEREIMRHY